MPISGVNHGVKEREFLKEDGGLVSKRRDVVVRWAKLACLVEAKMTKY